MRRVLGAVISIAYILEPLNISEALAQRDYSNGCKLFAQENHCHVKWDKPSMTCRCISSSEAVALHSTACKSFAETNHCHARWDIQSYACVCK
jgi:hypothetical protein